MSSKGTVFCSLVSLGVKSNGIVLRWIVTV